MGLIGNWIKRQALLKRDLDVESFQDKQRSFDE